MKLGAPTMMQRPTGTNGLLSASPTTVRNAPHMRASLASPQHPHTHVHPHPQPHPSPNLRRPSLPDRNVTEDTIEDAYVRFILHCNPAVPPETDPTSLKDAFRVPPKSEGKVFSTFVLYELIGKLILKDEIKTWGDLALRLGVEPPNQEKNQSSQKIQQYAVRLKRWMKSMHIDAFFDYLHDNAHSYWTQIPPENTPILETARDGVLPEDDMALRALLPQIRPRRGRRTREEDEANKSPSKLPRLESPMADEFSTASTATRPDALDPWSAHPGDGRASSLFPQTADSRLALSAAAAPLSGHPWVNELHHSQPPLSAYPHSAVTPSTRAAFWADEPKSAITPSKTKPGHKRHGPKVVSSAWRSGPGGSGKTRGRPPINRNANDGPFSAFPTDAPPPTLGTSPIESSHARSNSDTFSSPGHVLVQNATPPPPAPTPIAAASLTSSPLTLQGPPIPPNPRPPKPGRLSLQVPKIPSGEVRLATPPPVVMVNGETAPVMNGDMIAPLPPPPHHSEAKDAGAVHFTSHLNGGSNPPPPEPETQGGTTTSSSNGDHNSNPNSGPHLAAGEPPHQCRSPPPKIRYKDPTDRTNLDGLEGFFVHEIMTANWFDKNGKQIPRCGVDEAYAIVKTVIENLQKAATTTEGFLINVSALAGGKLLMTTTSLKITLVEVCSDHTKYICDWQLQLGDLKGTYSMNESVRHDRWKRPPDAGDAAIAAAAMASTAPPNPAAAPANAPPEIPASGATTATEGRTVSPDAAMDSSTEDGSDAQQQKRARGQLYELSAEEWKQKYTELAEMYRRKDQEASRLQFAVMEALRDPRLDRQKG